MAHENKKNAATPVRSTQLDFLPEGTFPDRETELLYYKQEYRRLKAIIALQKKKIRKLLG